MLMQRDFGLGPRFANASVTVCHSQSRDLKELTRLADILVVAIGKPEFITADMIRPGVVIADVGINRVGERLVGDVDFAGVQSVSLSHYTRARWHRTANNCDVAPQHTDSLWTALSAATVFSVSP